MGHPKRSRAPALPLFFGVGLGRVGGLGDFLAGVYGEELEAGIFVALDEEFALEVGSDVGLRGEPERGFALGESDGAVVHRLVERFEPNIGNGREQVGFEGRGCAISIASASMMTTVLKGRSVAAARKLFVAVQGLCTGKVEPADVSRAAPTRRPPPCGRAW